jgi:hypothetical protein
MKEQQCVYHASPEQDLKILVPNISTHQKPWLYASNDIVVAATFLSSLGGDFYCSVGRDIYSKKIYICERQIGGFEKRYANTKGSIYTLSSTTFGNDARCWQEELVTTESIKPIKENKIENVITHLKDYEKENQLLIIRYPQKISLVPTDDVDLIIKAIKWYLEIGEPFIDYLVSVNPNIFLKIKNYISS